MECFCFPSFGKKIIYTPEVIRDGRTYVWRKASPVVSLLIEYHYFVTEWTQGQRNHSNFLKFPRNRETRIKKCNVITLGSRVMCKDSTSRHKRRSKWGKTYVYIVSFIASGVGLSPLYCGRFWPIVPAPDDRWGWLWSNWWNEDWQGIPKYSEKNCPSATLSTTNPTWPDLGSNPGRRRGKPGD
jgi:hypothetical protein